MVDTVKYRKSGSFAAFFVYRPLLSLPFEQVKADKGKVLWQVRSNKLSLCMFLIII